MRQTFKQYLIEARYGVRAELKPRALVGSYVEYNENMRRGYEELSRGRFPVIRLFTQHWKYGSYGFDQRTPLENRKTEVRNWVLRDPKPIIVNVVNEATIAGKRLSQIEIVEGGDQLVSYWITKPYKGWKKRANVMREDPNFETGEEEPLSSNLSSEPLYAMTKDLKRL